MSPEACGARASVRRLWGLEVRVRRGLAAPSPAPHPLPGHRAGAPRAPELGEGLAARPGRGWGGGAPFPSQGLPASRTETQTSGFSSGMPRRAEAARSPAGGGAAATPGPQFPMRGPLHARGVPEPTKKGGRRTGKALGLVARRAGGRGARSRGLEGARGGGGARRRGASRAAAPAG